jgi:aminoglycoside phosphotransferase
MPLQASNPTPTAWIEDRLAGLFPGRRVLRAVVTAERRRRGSILSWVRVELADGVERVVTKAPRLPADDPRRAGKMRVRLAHEYESGRLVRSRLGDDAEADSVAMLAHFSDVPSLVMEEVDGTTLYALIERGVGRMASAAALAEAERACRAAGRLLRRLQDATAEPGARFSLDEMIEYVDVRLRSLIRHGVPGVDEPLRRRVIAAFDAARPAIGDADARLAGAHGDCCPANVMFGRGRVVLIDLSQYQVGSRFHDLTRFYHQMALFRLKPTVSGRAIDRLQAAFLSGYGGRVGPGDALFRLFLVQHTVCHWLGGVKRGARSWSERAFTRWVARHHHQEVQRLVA